MASGRRPWGGGVRGGVSPNGVGPGEGLCPSPEKFWNLALEIAHFSVRPSVTLVYSIHTTEDIVKFLSPSGTPLVGAQSTRGWEKFAIFDRNLLLSRKRYEIGSWLLVNAYRKSYALYRMMTFSMTSTDPYPGFQGHGVFYVEYLKNFFDPWLTDKLLLNSDRKPHIVYRMVPISMSLSDLWPGIQSHDIFEVEYLKNSATYGKSYYSTLIGIWKPYLTCEMVPCLETLTDL